MVFARIVTSINLCVPVGLIAWGLFLSNLWSADGNIESPPIAYSRSQPSDVVSALQEKLDQNEIKFSYDEEFGYLPSVLAGLQIDHSSQTLVFSKTSLQQSFISPSTPRAIYFNEDVYVAYCQGGRLVEISTADPNLGAVFYTLNQEKSAKPRFDRRTENCLSCHRTPRTESVPGHFAKSIFVDQRGRQMMSPKSYVVDHSTPIEVRWGGWYVTGDHGKLSHLGNLAIAEPKVPKVIDNQQGQNLSNLDRYFDTARYLTPHSDIVALMVLEHQMLVHNRIAKATYEAKREMYRAESVSDVPSNNQTNKEFSADFLDARDRLVEALLMYDEAKFETPIRGHSGYAENFQKLGPTDLQGRSLRALDLERRLFRYPCSYLIYSKAFRGIPESMQHSVLSTIREILESETPIEKYSYLTPIDRENLLQILEQTKVFPLSLGGNRSTLRTPKG